MITLRDIDDDNFNDCVDLALEDERFVGSATYVLAGAYACRHYMTTYGIYKDNEVIGMVQVRNKPANHEKGYAFSEIFIAKNHLRKGYGQQAVAVILKKLKHDNGFESARVCVDVENPISQNFFKKCGFTEVGKASWDDRYIDYSISLS